MSKVYVVTEEEFMSLIESLELIRLRENNVLSKNPDEVPTKEEMHRAFHYVVVRWVQAMGFQGFRG